MLGPLLAVLAAIAVPARPAHFVTDNAGVMEPARAAALEKKLAKLERETSNQVLVYVDRRVPAGMTLEQVGLQALRDWGLGQNNSNGAILFLFVDDRKTKIEVGRGLEATLTDERAKLITSAIVSPRLRSGDYAGAVEHGVEAVLNSVARESYDGGGRDVSTANAGVFDMSFAALGAGAVTFIALLLIRLVRRMRAAEARAPRRGTDE